MKRILFSCIFILSGFLLVKSQPSSLSVDPLSTDETKALYENLKLLSGKGILFGHQDDLAYGVSWKDEPGRSDIKESCGDFPAVFGWDVSKIGQRAYNIDSVDFDRMKDYIRQGFNMGGVITISWHMDNPVTGGSSWDKSRAVYSIIPGGEKHDFYKRELDVFAEFLNTLSIGNTELKIPVIFRPFHEHTGNWFWWGDGNCTRDEYVNLWQFTVQYLRDVKGIHHLLYAYSTDVFQDEAHFLKFYPGDEYVDILAFDDYRGVASPEGLIGFKNRLRIIGNLAESKNKIAALSETGVESMLIPDWHTKYLLESIKSDPAGEKIVWVLLWRNANVKHHFASYKGHVSQPDFVKFYDDPYTLFIKDLPDLYQLKSK